MGGSLREWVVSRFSTPGLMRIVVVLASAVLTTVPVQGQHPGSLSKRGTASAWMSWFPETNGGDTVDVMHYDLRARLAMVDEQFSARMRMQVRLAGTPAGNEVRLHAVQLTIDSVRINGLPSAVTVDSLEETIRLLAPVGTVFTGGETLDIVIDYRRVPGLKRPSSRRGYYYFRDTIGIPANLGYTMSEPSDARFWMPCHDEPWDKATADLHLTVPEGYVAASNGALIAVEKDPGGTVTWRWRERNALPPYLMSITASRFTISTLPFERAPGDTVPLQYYVWPPDSLETALYLPTVRTMMSGLSGLFGPYPFDKYGMTAIVPFGFGGMEHQTITTMNRFLKTDERVVLHELAHQWWGNLVTCGSWKDIWLNEGFATYSEALWAELKGGPTALRRYMKDDLEHFQYGSWQGAVYDPQGQGFNLFDDVVYSKGAWVLHTLRGLIGDSAFFAVLARYREAFSGGNATTSDLQAVAEAVTGMPLADFFAQWVYGKGWPVYGVSQSWTGDSLLLTVRQLQSAGWPTFTMPLTVAVRGSGADTSFVVMNNTREQTYRIPLPFAPDTVLLDPEDKVLKQVVLVTTTAESDPLPANLILEQNYPNPFNPATTIRYTLGSGAAGGGAAGGGAGRPWVKLAVYDLLGREVAVLVREAQLPGDYVVRFDASDLASGVYLCRLQAGPLQQVRRMVLIR